ncbi:MAG: carboxypeptidase-like regulatory domain-containing protein, partial [Bacteroidetes bacterium]|nr:carboxypeptidase-like regulatory domain-containing protein [Bacteroidota bacterium]
MGKYYKRLKLLLLLCFLTPVALAQFSVSGQITDDVNGEPLIGVNVVIKGTSTGVTTGIDGNYSITIPGESGTLVYTSIGYLAQEVPVDAASETISIALSEDVFNLQEVVITGLASSVKRSNLANAVSTVSAKELTGATSVQTLDAALQGKVTGANIYSNSGAPGGGISIKLRGNTTITGSSEPLYIVDGVYMDNSAFSAGTNPVSLTRTNGEITDEQDNPSNRIADLDPEDIENIEI